MIRTWLSASFEKVAGNGEIPKNDKKDYKIYAAKNEYEGCTVSFCSDEDLNGLDFVCTENESGLEYALFTEYFVRIDGVEIPDPLRPYHGEVVLEKGKIRNLYIRFKTENTTSAGEYTVKFALKNANGEILSEVEITIHVWNFAIPEKLTFETAMWLGHNSIAVHSNLGPKFEQIHDPEHTVITPDIKEKFDEYYKKYYDFLLDYKVTVAGLPYDILDPRADEYLDNPKVTTVFLNNTMKDEEIIARYNKLKSKPEWFAKAYMYPYDEPNNEQMLNDQKKMIDHLKELCPDIRFGCAYFMNVGISTGGDQLDFMKNYLEILCPKLFMFQSSGYRDRLLDLRANGKKIWSYVCWEPGKPYVNLFLNEPGLDHRLMIWQMHRAGAEGFLYWNATYWRFARDPWEDMATVKWLTDKVYGDGSLTYPGQKFGIDGPCPSIRLEALRDGIEDCEIILLAEKVLGTEKAFSYIDRLSQGVVNYTESADDFHAVRAEMGEAIEKALNK